MTTEDTYWQIADAMLAAVDQNEIPVREDNGYLLELLAETARVGYNLRVAEESAKREEEGA